MDFEWININIDSFFRSLIVISALVQCLTAISIPIIPIEPVQGGSCNSQNCVMSSIQINDEVFNQTFGDEAKEEIVLVQFQSCQMSRLPTKFFDIFTSLVYLIVSNSGPFEIDEHTFDNASDLQSISLQDNLIEILPSFAFIGSYNLNELGLANNQIETISEDAFGDLIYLETLDLSGNKLTSFYLSTFHPLMRLSNLDLSGNDIELVDGRIFMGLEKLTALNLGNNQIMKISHGFSRVLPQINSLSLMSNPCTVGTMLEKFPIIKLMSGRLDNKALIALRQCSLELYPDPETTDLFDLVETAREDADAEIIADLTGRLHEKDNKIEVLEARMQLDRAVIILFLILAILCFAIPYIIRSERLRSTKLREIKVEEKDLQHIKVDPKKIIYTIKI